MAIVLTDSKHYSGIAEAIREKTGGETTYRPEDMPSGVSAVYDAGHDFGWAAGTEHGRTEGQMIEYERFWDAMQNYGDLTNYRYGFAGPMWNDITFAPRHSIVPTGKCGNFMYGCAITNLAQIFDDRGVTLDTSEATELASAFANSSLTHIPTVSAQSATALTAFCSYCPDLVTIDKLILKSDGTNTFTSAFDASPNLENLNIEGVIGTNGLNLSKCEKLSKNSLLSVINALQNKSSGTWTVTLGSTNLAKLTDSEKAIATEKGWTLV